ncbi:histone-lysine N-methyltransferase EHMT1-like [Saccoglossus kowalevskii]|uniref:Histone-lysine N-methyltransferase EHMT2-like n=1 Tax=Saccoglossus kowalevskii TaxID=10224 RepID=A0ABM0M583_SACKO|nr:PREDICTED: histone-lysine N-methyltransferase EHMT2-like [Saccoglossus kowalevskii]
MAEYEVSEGVNINSELPKESGSNLSTENDLSVTTRDRHPVTARMSPFKPTVPIGKNIDHLDGSVTRKLNLDDDQSINNSSTYENGYFNDVTVEKSIDEKTKEGTSNEPEVPETVPEILVQDRDADATDTVSNSPDPIDQVAEQDDQVAEQEGQVADTAGQTTTQTNHVETELTNQIGQDQVDGADSSGENDAVVSFPKLDRKKDHAEVKPDQETCDQQKLEIEAVAPRKLRARKTGVPCGYGSRKMKYLTLKGGNRRSLTVSELLAQKRKAGLENGLVVNGSLSDGDKHRVSKWRKTQGSLQEENEKVVFGLNLRPRKRPETDTDTDSVVSGSSSVSNSRRRRRGVKGIEPERAGGAILSHLLDGCGLNDGKTKKAVPSESVNKVKHEPPLCSCKMAFGVQFEPGVMPVCRAVEYLDGQLKLCEAAVSALKQVRPSTRVKFMVLCNDHLSKMARHQCCPGCGVFCSLGSFTICTGEDSVHHHFHRKCISETDGTLYCPHCGDDARNAKDVRVVPQVISVSTLPDAVPATSLPLTPGSARLSTPIVAPGLVGNDSMLASNVDPNATKPVGKRKRQRFHSTHRNFCSLQCCSNNSSINSSVLNADLIPANELASDSVPTDSNSYQLSSPSDSDISPRSKARMSVPLSSPAQEDKINTLMPPKRAVLPNGQIISTEHFTSVSSREVLEQALKVLEDEKPKKLRFFPKNLYMASKHGELEKVLYMLAEGFDPNCKFVAFNNSTALHGAAMNGHVVILSVILQSDGNIDSIDAKSRTPLMEACEFNQMECVQYLVKAGANINAREDDGMSCLHLAAKAGHLEVVKYIQQTHSIDINIQDDGGWTAMIWASENRHKSVVEFLLEHGSDPHIRDNEENISLHWAVYGGCEEIAELFLNAKCNLHCINVHGDTPLHIAARENHYVCVELLLSRGADINAKNKEGETPLDCCQPNSKTWTSLQVNMRMKQAAANRKKRTEKILHRDISRGRENIPIPIVNGIDDCLPPDDFLYITQCCETAPLSIDMNIRHVQGCRCQDDCLTLGCICAISSVQCWYEKDGRLTKDFNALEPPLLFECNRACGCWNTCNNRVIQNGSRCHLQLYRTNRMGWGLRTIKDVPQGTFVCEYIGEIISDEEADRRQDDSYLFDLENREGEIFCLDARHYGNISRFINHLCDPNLVPVRFFVDHQDLRFPRIAFFTSRDVKAYEELGFDYGDKFWSVKGKYFSCQCGSEACKHSITLFNS